MDIVSQKPFLIRAIHEWCQHNGFTPYLLVQVDQNVRVPPEYVKDNQIVLNVSYNATDALILGNDFIELKARFGGRIREIIIPIERVAAIYARENGQGMGFEVEETVFENSENKPSYSTNMDEGSYADEKEKTESENSRAVVLSLHPGGKSAQPDGDDAHDEPQSPNDGGGGVGLRRIK